MVPIQPEGLTELDSDHSLFMRRFAELKEEQELDIYDAFNIPKELMGESPVGSVTATEEALNKMSRRVDAQRYVYLQTYKEEDKMTGAGMNATLKSEPQEYWSLYQVLVVDKEDKSRVTPNIEKKVIAKNAEHAKGIAGVTDLLAKKDYDNTKLAVRVSNILDIRPVEDDE